MNLPFRPLALRARLCSITPASRRHTMKLTRLSKVLLTLLLLASPCFAAQQYGSGQPTNPNPTSLGGQASLGSFASAAALQSSYPAIALVPGTLAYTTDQGQMVVNGSQTWVSVASTGSLAAIPSGTVLGNFSGISAPPTAQAATQLTSGTSGGIPCWTASNILSSSAVLTSGLLMIGGGVGACPSVLSFNPNPNSSVTNTAFGSSAIQSVTANGNTGFGNLAGGSTSTGAQNAYFGFQAGNNGTTFGYNVAVGAYAMGNTGTAATTSFAYNVAVGNSALALCQGNCAVNTAVGGVAGQTVTTGANNTIIGGAVASTTLQSGSNNVLIGYSAATDTPANNSSNEVNIAGLLFWNSNSLAAPAVTACGTSPTIDAHANNRSGTVTVGSGTVSSCTVTLAGTGYSTWSHCRVTPHQSIAAFSYSYTKTVLTITATSLTSDVFDYDCDGY